MKNKDVLDSMVGETIYKIIGLKKGSSDVEILTKSGKLFHFFHYQDCCENVDLEDLECDIDCEGSNALIISSEEVVHDTNYDNEDFKYEVPDDPYRDDSSTWTFYKIETNKGGIFMRWLGTSNGYYGEEVTVRSYNRKPVENKPTC